MGWRGVRTLGTISFIWTGSFFLSGVLVLMCERLLTVEVSEPVQERNEVGVDNARVIGGTENVR